MPRKRKRRGPRRKPGPKPKKKTCAPLIQRQDARERLIADLELTGGHVARTAWLMSVHRNTVYNMINRWKLWAVVNRCRRDRLEGRQTMPAIDMVQRARLALRG